MRFEDELLPDDREFRRAAFFSILQRIAVVVLGAIGIAALYGAIITKVAA